MLGTIILKPREAKLYQNAKCPTRTEPYCIAILGNCSIRGVTCKNGGPMARWMDTMIFQFRKEKYCYVEVKDKYILTNDGLLGVCKIDLVNLVTEKGSNRWYDLYLKKRITGQIWIEVLYIDRSHPSQNINNIKENNLRQSREQSALFEKNMQRHFQGNDELVVHSEGNEPRPPSSLQNFELYLNDKKLDSANKQEEINESRKFNTEPHSERMNMVDASIRRVVSPESNKNFRNSQAPTTPSKSQLEVQQEFLVLAKKPRKKSLGRKILDSIKNIFTGKAPQRKKSLQIEPFRRNSFKEPEIVAGCDSNANNVSPIKNGKSDHDQSSISTIKSLVFDQKSDAPLEIPLKEPSPILSEIVMNENKGVHKKKVSFSLNTLGDEDKENSKPPVNQLVKDHVAPVPVLWKSSQKKNEIHETDLNIKDKANHKEINQDSEVKKDRKVEVENDQTNWLEMTKKGFIIIEDLSNNEKRILDVRSSRIDQEIEPIKTTPRTAKVNTYKTENCNEGLNRRSRRFR